MLHIALIVGIAYAAVAVLGFLVVLPILRAGSQADRSMAAEEVELPPLADEANVPARGQAQGATSPRRARAPRGRRFTRRARRPLATRRPGT